MNKFYILVVGLLLAACSTQVGSTRLESGYSCEEYCTTPEGSEGVQICHVPPGNEDNPLTLCVASQGQLNGHYHHPYDSCGECEYPEADASSDDASCDYTDAGQEGDAGSSDDAGAGDDAGQGPDPDASTDPVCGDSVCNGEETCRDCPFDCGYCETEPNFPDSGVEVPSYTVSGGGCNSSGTSGFLSALGVLMVLMLVVRKSKQVLLLALILSSTLIATNSYAQVSGDPGNFGTERFKPGLDEGAILNVEDGNVGQEDTWAINAWVGHANDPLVIVDNSTGQRVNSLIGYQMSSSLGAYYVFAEKTMLALTVPMTLRQGRDSGLFRTDSLTSGALGDIRLDYKTQLVQQSQHDFDLALGLFIELPTSTENAYAGDEAPSFGLQLSGSKQFSQFRASVNLGFSKENETSLGNLEVQDEVFARLGVATNVGPGELGVTLAASTPAFDFIEAANTNYAEAMVGYSKKFGNVLAYSGAGVGLNEGFGSPDWRVLVGLRYTKSPDKPVEDCGPPLRITVVLDNPPEETPPEEPPATPEEESKLLLTATDAYFSFDSSELKGKFKRKLEKSADSVADAMKRSGRTIVIQSVGHTDSIGATNYNMGLGLKRAHAVAEVFRQRGIQVVEESRGESEPIDTNSTTKGRAKNRRVEVFVTGSLSGLEIEYEKAAPEEDTYDSFGKLNRAKAE